VRAAPFLYARLSATGRQAGGGDSAEVVIFHLLRPDCSPARACSIQRTYQRSIPRTVPSTFGTIYGQLEAFWSWGPTPGDLHYVPIV